MARSTCNPNLEAPKGTMKFTVIRSTIRDSVGQYCAPGDKAILNKKMAKAYLDLNFIKVDIPEFDDEEFDADQPITSPTDAPAADAAPETEPGERGDGDAADTVEQPATEAAASPVRGQNRRRSSPNSP